MPIFNVNTIQDKISYSDFMTSYTDVYLKQSLANLGQRMSVKGDGVTTGEFIIKDVFADFLGNYSKNDFCKATYDVSNNTIKLRMYNYNDMTGVATLRPEVGTTVNIDYILHSVATPSRIQIPNLRRINDTDYYKKGGLIMKGDNYYIVSFVSMKTMTDDAPPSIKPGEPEGRIKEYFCDKISNDGRLIEGVRLVIANDRPFTDFTYCEYDSKTGVISYPHQDIRLLYLHQTENGYEFEVYTPNHQDVEGFETIQDYVTRFEDLMQHEPTQVSPSYIVDLLAPGGSSDDYFGWSLYRKYTSYKKTPANDKGDGAYFDSLTVDFDSEGNQYFKLNDKYSTIPLTDTDKVCDLNALINYWAYDITDFFAEAKRVYNSLVFVNDESEDVNLKLKKQIIGNLVLRLFKDYANQSGTVVDNVSTMFNVYFPINYTFYYNCNDNDQSIIYNTVRDITVKWELDPMSEIGNITGDEPQMCIIADTSEEKVALYGFTISYLDDEIINNVSILLLSTLPFINSDGYWVINGVQTDIYALGQDAGNPNIILTYTGVKHDDNYTYDIIHGADKQLLKSWEWAPQQIMMEPLERDNNIANDFYYILEAMLPSTEQINNMPPNQFSQIANALFVNFQSTYTAVYPENYNTVTYLKNSSYSNFTYDPTTAVHVKYNSVDYDPVFTNTDPRQKAYRQYAYTGQTTMATGVEMLVTDLLIPAGTYIDTNTKSAYINTYDVSDFTYNYVGHDAYNFTYSFENSYSFVQARFYNNMEPYFYESAYDVITAYLSGNPFPYTYCIIEDEGGKETVKARYNYVRVNRLTNFAYSYFYPLEYTVENTYDSKTEINPNGLLFKLGDNGVITTFWTIEKDPETLAYTWTYVKQPNNSPFALDTNYINNLDNNIKYYLNNYYSPDNYYHRWVVFNAVNKYLKNNTIDEDAFIWPVIQNKSRDYYAYYFGSTDDKSIDNTSYEIYNNDLNFQIAFYDDVKRTNVGEITYVGKKPDSRFYKGTAYYFHVLNTYSDDEGNIRLENTYTAYTTVDNTIARTGHSYDRYPTSIYNPNDDSYSYQYPTLDLKEVIVRDETVANRINILSFEHKEVNDGFTSNKSNMMFNAYFGTSSEDPDKTKLIIGTTSENISLGTQTMTTPESTKNLAEHRILQLNVDNIELNGYTTANKPFTSNHPIWNRTSVCINPATGENTYIYSRMFTVTEMPEFLGKEDAVCSMWPDNYPEEPHNVYFGLNHYYVDLSYNTSVLSYLRRKQSLNSPSRYMRSNGRLRMELSPFGVTLSYLNVKEALKKYCELDIDDGTEIHGDSQLLWVLSGNEYDEEDTKYAQNHANYAYFLHLTTDLALDENLLFSYDGDRYVSTNPISVTYANLSYVIENEYEVPITTYAFTYASSYEMHYHCDGCSLCTEATCDHIMNCKWSYIVGNFVPGKSIVDGKPVSTYISGTEIFPNWSTDINDPRFDKKLNDEKLGICNSYYAPVPVSYYDSYRNLVDVYLKLVGTDELLMPWEGAGTVYAIELNKQTNKSMPYYYTTEERDMAYVTAPKVFDEAPKLLIATYNVSMFPMNENTPDNRGWDSAYYTDYYGNQVHSLQYYDSNFDWGSKGYNDYHDEVLANDIHEDKQHYNAHGEPVADADVEAFHNMMQLANAECTYTAYFSYIVPGVRTTYTYMERKVINIREVLTPHTVPEYYNGAAEATVVRKDNIEKWNCEAGSL